jgi:dihydrofolate reductase
MRKVTFGGATSLDNYLARKDHAVDWLIWSDEVTDVTSEYWKRVDTVLMGRRTYEVAGKGYPGVQNIVFSRTLERGADPTVTVVSDDAVEFVRDLKQGPGKEICLMGGGDLARSLFNAGLIDEVGLNIHPVLLGRGIPVFHEMPRQIDLELLECRRFSTGCVYIRYGVKQS